MFQPGVTAAKRCFTIESLVGKDSHPLGEEPLRPDASAASLGYPASAAVEAFAHGFQGSAAAAGRSLYGSPELLFPEAVSHPPALAVHPPQLAASHLPSLAAPLLRLLLLGIGGGGRSHRRPSRTPAKRGRKMAAAVFSTFFLMQLSELRALQHCYAKV